MIPNVKRSVPIEPINILSSLAVLIYVFLVFFTTIWILHESPMSAIPDMTVANATFEDLRRVGKAFGFTYGDENTPFLNQINIRLVFTNLIISAIFSLFFLILSSISSVIEKEVKWWMSVISGGLTAFLYLLLFFLLLVALPNFNYTTLSGNTIPVEKGILKSSLTFVLLILAQSGVVAVIGATWSRPIVPSNAQWNWDVYNNPRAIHLNLENWNQYTSWIITTFGGSLVTVTAVYIIRSRGSESTFLLHAAILFGGGLSIILLFIIYKMICLEGILTNNSGYR